MTVEVTIVRGVPSPLVPVAARLFFEAFRGKLERVLAPEPQALRYLERAIDPGRAIVALGGEGRLLGLVGTKTAEGAFLGDRWADLRTVYGLLGATWRSALLGVLARPIEPGRLLLDGIAVAEAARGQGIGQALLEAVVAEAARQGLREVRLDVIDENPRAMALYERLGFRATGRVRTGPLAPLLGFSGATTMIRQV